MPLFVVATPIGNPQDISMRAIEVLRKADVIIGEELKVLRQTLKSVQIQARQIDVLNEHSTAEDIAHFVEIGRTHNLALVSDCGTPGFCDPGAELVRAFHDAKIRVVGVPGPSSITHFLSVCGERLDRFQFTGFLPAKKSDRSVELKRLASLKLPTLLMETPYRWQALVADLNEYIPNKKIVVGLNLSQPDEVIWRGVARRLAKDPLAQLKSAEPIVLIKP